MGSGIGSRRPQRSDPVRSDPRSGVRRQAYSVEVLARVVRLAANIGIRSVSQRRPGSPRLISETFQLFAHVINVQLADDDAFRGLPDTARVNLAATAVDFGVGTAQLEEADIDLPMPLVVGLVSPPRFSSL